MLYKVKHQFPVIATKLFIITSTLSSSLLTYSYFPLLNSTAEASPSRGSSLTMGGIISSLILDIPPFDIPLLSNHSNNRMPLNIANVGKFILAGNWSVNLANATSSIANNNTELQVVGFEANFIAVSKDGTGAHTHQISNFKPIRNDSSKAHANYTKTSNDSNILNQDGDAYILGTVDVGMNGQKMWDNVNANIIISKGTTIEITLDERDLDYHFGKGQSIYGLVNTRSLT